MPEADDLLARCLPHLYFKHPQQAGLREEIERYLSTRPGDPNRQAQEC